MTSLLGRSIFWPGVLLIVACSSGQCRRDGSPIRATKTAQTLSEKKFESEVVHVAKEDGSLQCGYRIGVTLEDMSSELQPAEILRSEKKHDGLMRIQKCGAATGLLNVYHIRRKHVRDAVNKGFKVLDVPKSKESQ